MKILRKKRWSFFFAKPQINKAKQRARECLHWGWSIRHCKKKSFVSCVSDQHSKAIWLRLTNGNLSFQAVLTYGQFWFSRETTLFSIYTTHFKIICVKTATIKNEALYKRVYRYLGYIVLIIICILYISYTIVMSLYIRTVLNEENKLQYVL